MKKEEEDARLLDRCEAKRKEWSIHWQCDEEVQNMQDKPWRNEELRRCEEALPRLREGDLEKASRMYKAKTRAGCDGLHPKIPLVLAKETRLDLAKAFERVSLHVVWAWAFPKEDLAGALWFFRAPEDGAVRRMCGRTVANHRGNFARIQVELLAVAHRVAGCIE